MAQGKTVTVRFNGGRYAKAPEIFQYDYGRVLAMPDIDLPDGFQVYFGSTVNGDAEPMVGQNNEVLIPDVILETSGIKYAWVFLHEGEDDGETEYVVTLNVSQRGKSTEVEPTPAQQDVITEAIAALNAGVATVEGIAEAIPQTIEDALTSAKESGEFDGPPGEPGPAGADGQPGPAGQDGADGQDGFSPTATVTKSGNVATISITDKNGTTTATVSDGTNGQDGQDGSDGADGVTFTPNVSAEGVISWTNDGGKTNPQSVNIKGPQGIQGIQGIQGETGDSGVYVGSTAPTDPDKNVWIDPTGEGFDGVDEAVDDWLDNHPEATTTVQDGSITKAKLDSNLSATVDEVGVLNNAINTVAYPNVFDRNNSALIVNDKGVSETGDIIDRTGFSIIKIPVNGIDGNEYNVYLPNSGNTGFIPGSVRFAMYTANGTKLGVLVNNSATPAIVNNADCRYLYTTVGTTHITNNKVMILKNTKGATLSIWDLIPFESHEITDLHWSKMRWASYGDSITAINNGDFLGKGWAKYINYEYGFSQSYGRGIGGQTYQWGTNGGIVAFVNTQTGEYVDRNGNYNLDNFPGPVPAGCTAVRGAMCSWLRIKTMFPASIKNDINMVFIMAGSNDTYTAGEELSWVANDVTDPEWAASEEYETYGGDYNIATTIGAVASTVMKFQAWMPNAVIILGTPLNGNVSGIAPDTIPDEYEKGQYIKTVANIFGIPCIDVFGTAGINVLNATKYISDGVHPYTVDGCKMLARAVIGGLRGVYPKL